MEDIGDSTEVPVEDSTKGIIKPVAPYKCTECGRTFRRRSNLSRHQRLHSGERPFECPQCHRLFAHHSSLLHHLRLHTGERPYQCSVCLRTFRQRPNYSLHLKTHTGDKNFRCLTCGKEFAQRVHLTTHARLHSGELPYACQDCGRRFSQRCHLTRHRSTRDGEAKHLCHLCGGKFLSQSCLNSHLKTHDAGTHFKAQKQCRSQKSSGKTHESGTHVIKGQKQCSSQKNQDTEDVREVRSRTQGVSATKDRVMTKVECDICHKTFRKAHLRHHRYTHTGERPYPCPQCGRRFSEAGSLRRHMTSHIRAHIKHSSRTTPHTPDTSMDEDSNIKPHQEVQEGDFSTTNNPENGGELLGSGVESWVTTTPASSPHHHAMSSHTTEIREAVCILDNAVCTTSTSNNCLRLGTAMPESKDCFDKNSSKSEARLRQLVLTSQSTPSLPFLIKPIEIIEKQGYDPLSSLIKQNTTEKQAPIPLSSLIKPTEMTEKQAGDSLFSLIKQTTEKQALDPHSSQLKQTEMIEKQTQDPTLIPHSDLHSQSQTKLNGSCDGRKDMYLSSTNKHSQAQTKEHEGKMIKPDDNCDNGKDITGCTKLMDNLNEEERTDHTNKPDISPHTPKTLVAVSLFLFGKRVKEEIKIEDEGSIKEELELIEETV